MSRPNYLEQVKDRINKYEAGAVFSASDFSDIADAKTIHMSLSRLADENIIHKVIRGIYLKPHFSSFLNEELQARPDDVARCIARNYGWTIVPCDDTALNLLGLSTQIPAKWLYISDGPYKEYCLNNATLLFKHTDKNTELTKVSYITALVIRALKAIGKEQITDTEIKQISGRLTKPEKDIILTEAKYCTSWVYEKIKQIYLEDCDA